MSVMRHTGVNTMAITCDGPHIEKHRPQARFSVRVLDSGTPETEYNYCQKCFENEEYWAIVNEDRKNLSSFGVWRFKV